MTQPEEDTTDGKVTDAMAGLLDHYPGNDGSAEASADEESTPTVEKRVVDAFHEDIDPKLVDAGWGFRQAKSVEFSKTDQSLVNHVRNGVTALARVNEAIEAVSGYPYNEGELRDAIALFTIHDVHKLDEDRDENPDTRFDIPESEIEAYVERFGLLEWAESLTMADFHSCAIDHHDTQIKKSGETVRVFNPSNPDQTTHVFDEFRPLIRLADALASSETPEAATGRSVTDAVQHAYPNAAADLRRHSLTDVKGILTNLVNAAVAETLEQVSYEQLLIYQDGCVYLAPEDATSPTLDEQFVFEVFDNLKQNIRQAHPAYQNHGQLEENLTVRSMGFYGINDQDFFYAGAETVLQAIALKGATDADPSSEPTTSMADSMELVESYLPFEIARTREPVGLARFVYTVKRSFIDPVIAETDGETSELAATCDVFGVAETVQGGLEAATEEDSLTAGGKWNYSYGIGQALMNEGVVNSTALAKQVSNALGEIDEDWSETVETEHAGNLRSELIAYLNDVISVDGRPVSGDSAALTDPFEEYAGSRRGKTCVLCNRGTTGTKGDMKAPKSLTTLQAGYSNHIAVDSGKPDELLACYPCKIELSLRETGSGRREDGRLWFHFVPDYFYTPLSWQQYSTFTANFHNEAKTELGRLAEAVLRVGDGGISPSDDEEVLGSYVAALLDNDHGRSMIETLDQGFDPNSQYGSRTFGYFKPTDNDTEFQFFGVFVALALSAYTGLRVVVSESPIPDVRGRDFQTYARIGGGFTQVHDFYGTDIPLSELRSRLNAAAALIQLGYGAERDDALFAKYLRATRNKWLPGSYLLKRLAQTDDGSDAGFLLEEARVLDEETGQRIER
jgi:CRISPR-associated protein Csc3